MHPATVIVDTLNVYGLSESVLGRRAKPDPDGLVAAFKPLGFDVDDIQIAVAEPEASDIGKCVDRLSRLSGRFTRLGSRLRSLSGRAQPAQADLVNAAGACDRVASQLAAASSASASDHRALLGQLHSLQRAAMDDAGVARDELASACSRLAGLRGGSVSTDLVSAAVEVARAESQLSAIATRVSDIGSYLYAAGANSDYLAILESRPATPGIMRGRFPIGADGGRAGEKQVDTLCAVECVEATRSAVEARNQRAVIVLSDDDDITPALVRAATIAAGTDVKVIVAGSLAVSNRHRRSSGVGPTWFDLDASTLCRIVGENPAEVAERRCDLAALALGNGLPFTSTTAGMVATSHGLQLPYDGQASSSTTLYARSLSWGRDFASPLPRVVLAPGPARALGRVVQAVPGKHNGSNIVPREHDVPVLDGSSVVPGRLGAPGWWQVGDEIVIVDVAAGGRTSQRVVGHAPGTSYKLAEAERAEVRRLQGPFALVSSPNGVWETFTGPTNPPLVGSEVIIWPYETARRGGRRLPPRAVVLSSAL